MDTQEAAAILEERLTRYAGRGYRALVPLLEAGHVETFEVEGSTGDRYQMEIELMWDDEPHGAIRIVGAIDNGGLRSFFPLDRSEVVLPPKSSED